MVTNVFDEVDMALSKNQEDVENQMDDGIMVNANDAGKKKNVGRSTQYLMLIMDEARQ
jgi:hypothetical protein